MNECKPLKAGVMKTVGLFDSVKSDAGHVEDPVVCYVKAKKLVLEVRRLTVCPQCTGAAVTRCCERACDCLLLEYDGIQYGGVISPKSLLSCRASVAGGDTGTL